jgi:hypothetical protein
MDWPHNVRAAKAFSAAVEIVFKVVIQLERLPGLNGGNAIEAPAVGDALPAAFVIGERVKQVKESLLNI